jgi:hypothetical protein
MTGQPYIYRSNDGEIGIKFLDSDGNVVANSPEIYAALIDLINATPVSGAGIKCVFRRLHAVDKGGSPIRLYVLATAAASDATDDGKSQTEADYLDDGGDWEYQDIFLGGGVQLLKVVSWNLANPTGLNSKAVISDCDYLVCVNPSGDDVQAVTAAVLNSGCSDSGYSANDILTVSGGTGAPATLKITSVDPGDGAITGVTVLNGGSYTEPPSLSGCAVTGGTGTGATFDLTLSWCSYVAVEPQLQSSILTETMPDGTVWNYSYVVGGTPQQRSASNSDASIAYSECIAPPFLCNDWVPVWSYNTDLTVNGRSLELIALTGRQWAAVTNT